MQIGVALSATAFFVFVLYLAAYRPVIFFGFLFVLFTLVWRTTSTAFIDLTGPVWSSQTLRYIGPGLATPLHVLAYFITLIPFLMLLRPAAIAAWPDGADDRPAEGSTLTLSTATVICSAFFLTYLFLTLVHRGPIPLFAHIERFVYTAQYGSAAHRWAMRYANFLAFWWGMMFAAERLRNRRTDIRFLALLIVLLAYAFLTGSRFSAFYSTTSFFVIPIAALIAVTTRNHRSRLPFFWIGRAFNLRDAILLGAVFCVAGTVTTVAIYNNLVSVRGYQNSEISTHFIERVLVQPSELGWISYERVFSFGHWHPERVYDFLFQRPLDLHKNTTPQLLMLEAIGEPRTHEHISGGFQFAGGFPEIFFELFGPLYAWPFIFGAGYIAAALTALAIRGTIEGRYASAFLSLYVLFGFDVMYIGGMLNFVAVRTYWIKIGALAVALMLESTLGRAGLPLTPWAIIRIPLFDWLRSKFRSNLSIGSIQ